MIVILKPEASEGLINDIVSQIEALGLQAHLSRGQFRTVIGVVGEEVKVDPEHLKSINGVEQVLPIMKPYKLASREFHKEDTVIEIPCPQGGVVKVGGTHCVAIAGPCAAEDEGMVFQLAREVKQAGATVLRGGAYKPRTSPYSFQGHGEDALKWLRDAGRENNMPVITEVMDTRHVQTIERYTDIFQIGARNMQNFNLLFELGRTRKPVVLKRGLAGSISEWLMSAEYVLSQGNRQVILCERGIKTFETSLRYTLDLSAVPVVKNLSHLPVIVDPSHAAGDRQYVPSLARAAIAAGADGIMVECHDNPAKAMCDGPQALLPDTFAELMVQLREIAGVLHRTFATSDTTASRQTPAASLGHNVF
ncbi:MAG TPA: 3-deoxy-7-phosphoheptulonate synthase [Phycisphaerae bacterium]|jgi:3-deoxy-7-phosphoheptulonate synthase|nr:3-deoxy-7-phosphoheptulonate synthase [Phycisphaerae bacterium]